MREPQEEQKQVLLDLKNVAEPLKLPILVIGAVARILMFDSRYNVEGRATIDLDFAVQVNDWSDFESFSFQMTKGTNPLFRATKLQHKFIHASSNIKIDIVPFGSIAEPNQEIQWSDGNQMSVLGFDEALSSAETLIIEGREIKVINRCALLVLKLIAWNDRRAIKDLEDINFILENYNNDERVFSELIDEIAQGIIEFQLAGIFLLVRDIKKTFSLATINKLKKVISIILENSNASFSQLVSRTLQAEEWDEKFETIELRFKTLQKSIDFSG